MKPVEELVHALDKQVQDELQKGLTDALIHGTGFFHIDVYGSIRYVSAKEANDISKLILDNQVNEDT